MTEVSGSIRIDEEKEVYRNAWGALFDDYVTFLPGGARGRYVRWRWEAPYSVAVLAIENGKGLLVHNFRHSARRVVREVPKGFAQPGLTPEETARAELSEEAGLSGGTLVHVGTVTIDPAFADHPMHLFTASDCTAGDSHPEESESIVGRSWVDLKGPPPTDDVVSLLILSLARPTAEL
jgi:8-oxo-dGTP pyrophosphatase MutT (NUDIX family)